MRFPVMICLALLSSCLMACSSNGVTGVFHTEGAKSTSGGPITVLGHLVDFSSDPLNYYHNITNGVPPMTTWCLYYPGKDGSPVWSTDHPACAQYVVDVSGHSGLDTITLDWYGNLPPSDHADVQVSVYDFGNSVWVPLSGTNNVYTGSNLDTYANGNDEIRVWIRYIEGSPARLLNFVIDH